MFTEAQSAAPANPRTMPSQAAPAEVATIHPLPSGPRRSQVVVDLLHDLERAGIRHVHWKSNVRLEDALCGHEDLDLLADPRDAGRFLEVVSARGFRLAVSRWGAGHPGVFHAVAWDADLGRIIDLHAYHQLISGDSFAKSFRLPVEQDLLDNAVMLLGYRVTEPAAELGLFLVRTLLKHTSLIELEKVRKEVGKGRAELQWLLARTRIEDVEAWCRTALPPLPFPVSKMVHAVAHGGIAARVVLGLRLAWAVRSLRRIGRLGALGSRLVRCVAHYSARLAGRRTLSLQAGGSWIAFVGPKGTGKSTLSNLVARGFGAKLDVRVVHLGKPPPSWMSALPHALKPLLRAAMPGERLSEYERPERRQEQRFSTFFVLRKLLLAHDRRRLIGSLMRDLTSGTLVITDRCPGTNHSGLDGSAFDDLAVARAASRLQRWMMERERAIYRSLPQPTLVVKLAAPMEVAIARDCLRQKPGGPDAHAIRRRWTLESEAEFTRSRVISVSTSGSLDETFRRVSSEVWDAL